MRLQTLMLLCNFLVLLSTTQVIVAQDIMLRGFSHWEMSYQLRTSEETREAIDLSPSQKARLESLCNGIARANFFVPDLRSEVKAKSQSDVFMSKNKEVREVVATVLSEKQLAILFPVCLRAKFAAGYSPFNNGALLKALQVPVTEMSSDQFQAALTESVGKHGLALKRARLLCAVRVVNGLSESSKQRFVNWAGNTLVPTLNVDSHDDIAIPPRELTALQILESIDLQRNYKVSPKQLVLLQEIEDEFNSKVSEMSSGKLADGKRLSQRFQELTATASKAIAQVLTRQQVLAYSRDLNLETFLGNFRYPFSDQRVADYLGLDAKQQSELLSSASRERNQFFIERGKIDRSTFDDLCSQLPSESSSALKKLFADVWEIPMDLNVHWNAEW